MASTTSNKKTTQLVPEQNQIITISTHNVRGANQITKQNNILAEMKERNIDILGISEIKLSLTNLKYAFNDQSEYKCFASSGQNKPYGNGVAIIIDKNLKNMWDMLQK
jgi:Exonuclease III